MRPPPHTHALYGQVTDYLARFLPFDFRQTVVEHVEESSAEVSAIPHRPVTPGTPVIDRGFESMIDHKSIINQRIDTPVGRRQDDKDSDESHELASIPPPLPNGASASAEKTHHPSGESG